MSDELLKSLKTSNIHDFKEIITSILKEKIKIKINEIKESTAIGVEHFFDFIGGEDYEEFDDHISVVFPNKAALNYAITQLPDDLSYDIFYYDDIYSENPNDSEESVDIDDIENSVDIDDILDGDLDAQAFELVIYKDDDDDDDFDEMEESVIDSLVEDYYDFDELMPDPKEKGKSNAASKGKVGAQKMDINKLKSEFSKIQKIDPTSAAYKKFEKFMNSLDIPQLKGLVKADIKWVSMLARNRLSFKHGIKESLEEMKRPDGRYHPEDDEYWDYKIIVTKGRNIDTDKVVAKELKNSIKIYKKGGWTIDSIIDADGKNVVVEDVMSEGWGAGAQQREKEQRIKDYNSMKEKYKNDPSKWKKIDDIYKKGFKISVAEKKALEESDVSLDELDLISIQEANQNETGRQVKRRISYAKKRRGGKLINRRQRRRMGKVSKGVGQGYKSKGAGWKTKLIQSNRKRRLTKKQHVKQQKLGKRYAARSRAIRKKLGFKRGT